MFIIRGPVKGTSRERGTLRTLLDLLVQAPFLHLQVVPFICFLDQKRACRSVSVHMRRLGLLDPAIDPVQSCVDISARFKKGTLLILLHYRRRKLACILIS